MGKLVRDRIPEIIEARGDTASTRVLDGAGYEAALLGKLVEEASELQSAPSRDRLEEAADVYEVLLAIADLLGVTLDEIAERASVKRVERGGFEQRLWLNL